MDTATRVIITGSARGIGRGLAVAWAEQGAHVMLVARSTAASPSKALPGTLEDSAEAVEKAGGTATIVGADLSTDEGVARVVEAAAAFGGCDVLVNNAAVSFIGGFLDVPARRFAVAAHVNFLAPVALTHAVLPSMLERGRGAVINISSGASVSDDVVPQLPYGTTKAALERLSVGLHRQFTGQGVAFHCVRIDELVPTEAVTFSIQDQELPADVPVCSVDDLSAAVVLLAEHPELSGEVLTHGRLRELGLLAGK